MIRKMGKSEKRDQEIFRNKQTMFRNKNVVTKIKRKISMDRLNNKLDTARDLID